MKSIDMQDGLYRLHQSEKLVSEQNLRPSENESINLNIQKVEDGDRAETVNEGRESEQENIREKEERRRQQENREKKRKEKKEAEENIRRRTTGPGGLIVDIDA
ncbi:MAG: hypothetical protein ACLFQK_03910 [Fibrobacterota bacterium]